MKCNYNVAYQGPCQHPVDNPLGRCDEHKNLNCVCCGSPATHDCAFTAGKTGGGNVPLCDSCEYNHDKDRIYAKRRDKVEDGKELFEQWKRMPSYRRKPNSKLKRELF